MSKLNDTGIDKVGFRETVGIGKNYAKSVLIEGVEVPVVHSFGKREFSSYPRMRVAFAKAVGKFNSKVLGVRNPIDEKYIGTEKLIVEKYKEVNVAGIGNDAVSILVNKGYGFRQICQKIGRPVLTEINVSHLVRELAAEVGPLNVMLNEGIDQIWSVLTEDSSDRYTTADARVGVGSGDAAAVATQTALVGGSTVFKAMLSAFPKTNTAQRVDFKSSFASGEGEFAWEEFTVDNGVTANDNLLRLVASKGTKSAGEIWTAEIQITGS